MEKTTAILLKRLPLTETSLIVYWCSQTHGLIKTAAKGAKRPGSPLAGRLDLFYEAELSYTPSKRSDLHTLREVQVTNYRHGLHQSYDRILAASYFVRLIEMVAEKETPIAALHDLLKRGLDWLCDNDPTIKAVLHYEKQMAQDLGLWHPGDEAQPIRLIQEMYHHLPEQRLVLLERLQ